jgi:hypothetical protein
VMLLECRAEGEQRQTRERPPEFSQLIDSPLGRAPTHSSHHSVSPGHGIRRPRVPSIVTFRVPAIFPHRRQRPGSTGPATVIRM